ncbi:MAG: DUF4339 domain-containing protein [Planctomycetota bacterium]
MDDFGSLIVMLVFAAMSAAVAHARGRSALGWGILGFFFNCFALLLLVVLPDVKLEEERRERLRRENRRLSEQLKKERQVSDARHAQTLGRLGAHDAVLGLDTSSDADPRGALTDAGAAAGPPPSLPGSGARGKRWHYAVDPEGSAEGPVAYEEIAELWRDGILIDESLVWSGGMDDWLPIARVDELREELDRG